MKINKHAVHRPIIGLVAVALACLMSTSAQAVLLNLKLGNPDIVSGFMDINYAAAGDTLTANGTALEMLIDDTPTIEAIVGGSFDLTAAIDDSGLLSGGSLTIGGSIAALGFNSGTLLTGTLNAFGFNPAGNPLEFLFAVTGGDAAGLFGDTGGVILSDTGFGGSFDTDWGSTYAIADTAPPIPIPAALWLFGSGLLALFGITRRRKQC